MAARKKRKGFSIISILADMVLAYLKRVNDLIHLAALEAKLACKTLVVLSILIFVLGSILTTCWLSVLALLFIGLLALQFTSLSACLVVVIFNFLVLGSLLLVIYKVKDNLFFPATRSQLNYKSSHKANG